MAKSYEDSKEQVKELIEEYEQSGHPRPSRNNFFAGFLKERAVRSLFPAGHQSRTDWLASIDRDFDGLASRALNLKGNAAKGAGRKGRQPSTATASSSSDTGALLKALGLTNVESEFADSDEEREAIAKRDEAIHAAEREYQDGHARRFRQFVARKLNEADVE
ncbi:hypothetical protein [Pseudomonas sp. Marseille-Q7302]